MSQHLAGPLVSPASIRPSWAQRGVVTAGVQGGVLQRLGLGPHWRGGSCEWAGKGLQISCPALSPATCAYLEDNVCRRCRAVAFPGRTPPPHPLHSLSSTHCPGDASTWLPEFHVACRGPNQSAGWGRGGLPPPASGAGFFLPWQVLTSLTALTYPPKPRRVCMIPAKEPGSREWLLGTEGAWLGQHSSCWRRGRERDRQGQSAGGKTLAGRQEWRRREGRDQQVGAPVKPGVGAGDPPGGTSGARPGRLPSPCQP